MIRCCPSAATRHPVSPGGVEPQAARLIPLDFQHAPTPPKPHKQASEQERKQYRQDCRRAPLAQRGVERLRTLRQNLDQDEWNLVRAGVPERVVMAIGRWKTRSVFDRYNVVSERDLHDAARSWNRTLPKLKSNMTRQKQGNFPISAAPYLRKLLILNLRKWRNWQTR